MKNDIKITVAKFFIRVCKEHGFYPVVRRSFEQLSNKKLRFGISNGVTLDQSFDKIFKSAEAHYQEHSRSKTTYDLITFYINDLLRLFLEKGGVDPRRLGMFGQEIFDLSCTSLFGNKYKRDMERINKENGGVPIPKNDKEAWLIGQYMAMRQQGAIGSMSFNEFLSKISEKANEMSFDGDYNDEYRTPEYDDDMFDFDDEGEEDTWS